MLKNMFPTAQVKLDLRGHSMGGNETISSLCATQAPFIKRVEENRNNNLHNNNNNHDTIMSSTLPIIQKRSSSDFSTGDKKMNMEDMRKSVSAGNKRIETATSKKPSHMARTNHAIVARQRSRKRVEVDENVESNQKAKASTETDRQIAIERANRAVQKQRSLRNAEKERIAMERKMRADMIELKQKQRDRHRAEVYAVNTILKKLEMERFDKLREERGNDRSFLDDYSSGNDDISVDENMTIRTDVMRRANISQKESSHESKPLHPKESLKISSRSDHGEDIALNKEILSTKGPISTSESEACNFSFGV